MIYWFNQLPFARQITMHMADGSYSKLLIIINIRKPVFMAV